MKHTSLIKQIALNIESKFQLKIYDSYEKNKKLFMYWTGKVYAFDEDESFLRRQIQLEIEDIFNHTDELESKYSVTKKEILKYSSQLNYIDTLKRSILNLLKDSTTIPILTDKDFEKSSKYINTPNGVVDIETLKVYPHAPYFLMTQITSASLVSSDDITTKVKDFISFISNNLTYGKNDNQNIVNAFFSCLAQGLIAGNPEKIICFIIGKGNTGKSCLINLLNHMMGSYSGTCSSKAFTKNRKGSTEIRSDLIDVRNTRMLNISEMDRNDIFDEMILKSISGNDNLKYRLPHKSEFSFKFFSTIFVYSNYLPEISKTNDIIDQAFLNRIIKFDFTNSISHEEMDPNYFDKFYQKDTLDAIFTYIMQYANNYIKNRIAFAIPAVLRGRKEFFEDQRYNTILRFCKWNIATYIKNPEYFYHIKNPEYSSQSIYKAFLYWTQNNGVQFEETPIFFFKKIAQVFRDNYPEIKLVKKSNIYWQGLLLYGLSPENIVQVKPIPIYQTIIPQKISDEKNDDYSHLLDPDEWIQD